MPIKTAFPDDSAAGRLWAAIASDYKNQIKDVDHGFMADSLLYPVLHNTKNVIEAGEVMEFAYATPKYRHLLASENLPVPFVFTDFSNATIYDDQLAHDIEQFDQKLAERVTQKFKKESDDYRRELARLIYIDSAKRFSADSDCDIESTATEAARNHCGACTEASAQIFARLEAVGLNPQFNLGYDWKASMDWLDILDTNDQYTAHAWVSIPLEKGGALAVDTGLMRFGASVFTGTPISPREFTASWLGNRIMGKLRSNNIRGAIQDVQSLSTIAPRSLFALALVMGIQESLNDREAADRSLYDEERLSPNNPLLALFRHEFDKELDDYKAGLHALEKKSPKTAAYLYAQKANDLLKTLHKITGLIKETPPDVILNDPNIVQLLDYAQRALYLDPDLVVLFRNVSQFFMETQQFAIGGKFFYEASLKNKNHQPFAFMAAYFNVAARKMNDPSLDLAEKISTEWEPNNPRSFSLAASIMSARGKSEAALQLMRRGYTLWGDHKPKSNYYWMYLTLLMGKEKTETEFESVFSKFLKDHGVGAAVTVGQYFIEHAELNLDPKFNTESSQDQTRRMLALRFTYINTALEAFPTVTPYLDVMRILETSCYTLIGDAPAGQKAYGKIQDPTQPAVVKKTAQTLDAMTAWIKTTPPIGERLGRVLALSDQLRKNITPVLRAHFAKLDVACAVLFAGAASAETAKQHWHKALETDRPTAVQEAVTVITQKNDVAFIAIIDEGDISLTPKLAEKLKAIRANRDAHSTDVQLR